MLFISKTNTTIKNIHNYLHKWGERGKECVQEFFEHELLTQEGQAKSNQF